MAEQKKDTAPAPGTVAPTGAGTRGPTPEQQRRDAEVEAASAAPGEKRSASRPAARAAESGDPAVHKALADLQTAQMNLQDAQGGEGRDAAVAAAEQQVRDAEARL